MLGYTITPEQEAALLEFDKFLAMDDETALLAMKEVEAQQAAAAQAQAAAAAKAEAEAAAAASKAPSEVEVKLVSTLRRRDIRKSLVMSIPEEEIQAIQANQQSKEEEEEEEEEESEEEDESDDEDDDEEEEEEEQEEEEKKEKKEDKEAEKKEEPPAVFVTTTASAKPTPEELEASSKRATAATLASLNSLPIHPSAVQNNSRPKTSIFSAATSQLQKAGKSLGGLLRKNRGPKLDANAPTQMVTSSANGGAIRQSPSLQNMMEFLKTEKRPPKSQLYEVRLFSLSTAKTSVPYLVEAGADGFIIRDFDTGAFLREFPLKYIQSMHFIINNKTKERLFVLDYIRTDDVARGRHLVGRLVLSSEDNEVIFNELKAAMIALAKKKIGKSGAPTKGSK